MSRIIPGILALLLCSPLVADDGGPGGHLPPPPRRPSRSQNGNYSLICTGYYHGRGTGSITATTVSLKISVHSADGSTVTLEADNLAIDGLYFSGDGTLGNNTITVQGRLDAARASRLTASFRSSDGHRGRIVGTLPTDPGDDKWDDGPPSSPPTSQH